jgi:ATP-binding cassette subfamily C (CFTR/MRP) protein 4
MFLKNFLSYKEKNGQVVSFSKLKNVPINNGVKKPIINSASITTNNENGTLQSNSLRIVISNATAKWTQNETENSLQNINLTVKTSQLVTVIGPVGAGKVYKIINHYIFNNLILV